MRLFVQDLDLALVPAIHHLFAEQWRRSKRHTVFFSNHGMYELHGDTLFRIMPQDKRPVEHRHLFPELVLLEDASELLRRVAYQVDPDHVQMQIQVDTYAFHRHCCHVQLVIESTVEGSNQELKPRDVYFELLPGAPTVNDPLIRRELAEYLSRMV